MAKKVSDRAGRAAVFAWISGVCGVPEAGSDGSAPPPWSPDLIGHLPELSASVPRATVATAVRFTLQLLEARAPGQAVEVRVPPFGAVQILPGTTHRRGTPPAVVEMPAEVWLALAVGGLSWSTAISQGLVAASGNRADLGELLPLRI
ncbi:sterol carrier family protein [uncultured Mobiluncus sp.]|uniref:sterol carrier family protein n=1 Tax=uncultured Mobiluncus sp. TaxID=293425 RepID=UPI0025FE0836|nr:sterol carrier family protein [uncultured Mobiluncus sp.]